MLVHASPRTLEPYRCPELGVLCSPRRVYGSEIEEWAWAADNDAYSNWSADRYRKMLARIAGRPGCLFVTAPDVVGDSVETLRRFDKWLPKLQEIGQPIALVGQDGLEADAVPWNKINAFFVGGSTEWKMSVTAGQLVREAKTLGKWVHMGRVNTQQRLTYAKALDCDSIDGTSLSWFRDTYLPRVLHHAAAPTQMMLQ